MFVSESQVENRQRNSVYDYIYFSSGLHGLGPTDLRAVVGILPTLKYF